MQKKVLSLVLAAMPWLAIAQSTNNDWENPTVPSFNTVTPHAWFIPYSNEPAAIQQQSSSSILSLDGMWKFHIVNKPSDRPTDFYKQHYDVSKWSEIPVPANWQTVGKDNYIFTDVEYPIKVDPPFVPKDFNPVGSYKRHFNLPAGWKGKDVFLRFGAVNSFFYCWINDHYVGFSKDSKTPAEFDITPYLRSGSNTVSVQVFRFSDGTYLEGQDMWKLSGIERSVELIARPKLAVYDFFAKAGLDASYIHGVFDCTLTLNRKPAQKQIALEVKILDEQNNLVFREKQSSDTGRNYRFQTTLKHVKRWTAETPSLYTMVVNSFDKNGKLIESFAHRIGFRTAEVKHGLFLINGVPVKIKGVNRHEHDMFTAKVISKESMLHDIRVMKAFNINAVRNSHYPNSEAWYQLCDQYGIYLVDEANIECDGMDFHELKTLSDKPEWKAAYLDRTRRMFERDKNFTSIITWSLGNESRFGENFIATYQFLKANDDTRPVEYDEARDNPYTDIITPMYRGIHVLQEYVKEWRSRPFILCEYAHMMGNGGGNLKAYWDLIYSNQQLQGGFIWDFSDQTFEKKDAAGRSFWAYGRDMGNVGATSDTSFCADGLFDAARNPHPQAYELKKVYQPISFSTVGLSANTIHLINRTDFTNLNEYTLHWFIKADGKVVASGSTPIQSIEPHASGNLQLAIPAFTRQPNTEYFLTVEAKTNTATALIPAGHIAAWEQFELPGSVNTAKQEKKYTGPLHQQQSNGLLQFSNENMSVGFDQQTGWLTQYRFAGVEMLKAALIPHFWRAPTDTDIGNSMQIRCAVWQDPLHGARLDSFNIVKKNEYESSITTVHYLPAIKANYKVQYLISADGEVQVNVLMKAGSNNLPEMPRFGMRVLLQPEFNKVTWFGRGPFDNYDDRKTAAGIDLYSMPADSLFHPYPRAQESGYRTDVRWMGMQNKNGIGIMAIGAPTISTGVLHFDMQKLEFDRHAKENNHGGSMSNDPLIWWNIDYKQMGVGGDNSWGARTHAAYMLPYRDYAYSFTLRPVRSSDKLNEKAK